MKLSIVIICWNDIKVIGDCLRSIFDETRSLEFEVIISDNGSNDGSVEYIRKMFPKARIVENGANLGFARGNNAGINMAKGDYVLILNPDTIIRDHALEKLVAFAEKHPEAGAFGCRVLNPDGSYQISARPIPTVRGAAIAALYLRWLGRFSSFFNSDTYLSWQGTSERTIGFQSGCCVMLRGGLLRRLGGFDERFFYHYEETDLCLRAWKSGVSILFYPDAQITHLGGQSVGRFPIRFNLETYRGGYRFFFKHYGWQAAKRIRWVFLARLSVRWLGYRILRIFSASEALDNRLKMYCVALRWNWQLNPRLFIERGAEPNLGYEPMSPPPRMVDIASRPLCQMTETP